ncbi:MAG: UDP-N-acetyl-D-glucosamine dehydrogenase [Frankiaceae bacterium]|jgi:UDP-N-acetyl-D-glucosamine dehydrogenase|nr:UDP-N-acetyl-D-glucosamine dehydrogenase [Frankiaceae bacterium]
MRQVFDPIEHGTWTSAVVGLGYVGLPLVVTQAEAGIPVLGYDVSRETIDALAQGRSHIDDVSDGELAAVKELARFSADPADLAAADVVFICVPTPLAVGKQPDVAFIERAAEAIAGALRPGQLVVLESTTYPGTTSDVVQPILERSGLKLDEDFLLAYAPERVDPGNRSFGTANIPRVVGGVSADSTAAAEKAYGRFLAKVHPVRDARVAEMAKLLENTFRWVNIALVNEMASIARSIGVDIWEVIDAARTKPFGFMAFYPGPGVGGHCIPLDPFYLQWAARLTGEDARFIELAQVINARMPQVVVSRLQDALNDRALALRGAKVLVLGVAYKPNVRDYRESPSLEIIGLLQHAGAVVSYADPHVPEVDDHGVRLDAVEATPEAVRDADAVLILTDHDDVDYAAIAADAVLVLDTRNACRRRGVHSERVVVL